MSLSSAAPSRAHKGAIEAITWTRRRNDLRVIHSDSDATLAPAMLICSSDGDGSAYSGSSLSGFELTSSQVSVES